MSTMDRPGVIVSPTTRRARTVAGVALGFSVITLVVSAVLTLQAWHQSQIPDSAGIINLYELVYILAAAMAVVGFLGLGCAALARSRSVEMPRASLVLAIFSLGPSSLGPLLAIVTTIRALAS